MAERRDRLCGLLAPQSTALQTFRDIAKNEFILSTLVAKDLKALYRNMALGFFWALLQPAVMVGVLSFVLVFFLHGDPDSPALVVVAMIPHNFTAYCLSGCVTSISGNGSLVKKVAFPRQLLPIANIITHLVHFAIQCTLIPVVLLLFPSHFGSSITWNLLWLPLIFAVHLGLCVGGGLLVAGANVVYRDVQYIVDSVLTLMFWLAPVLYDVREQLLPKGATVLPLTWTRVLYFLNPFAGVLDSYRAVLYRAMPPDPVHLGLAVFGMLVIGYIGVRTFWVHERQFADLIA